MIHEVGYKKVSGLDSGVQSALRKWNFEFTNWNFVLTRNVSIYELKNKCKKWVNKNKRIVFQYKQIEPTL